MDDLSFCLFNQNCWREEGCVFDQTVEKGSD